MLAMPLLELIAPRTIILALGVGFIVLCLLTILVILVESVVLTLFRWNSFQRSLLASGIANITSSLIGSVLLIFLQKTPLIWIGIAFPLCVLIEVAILNNIQSTTGRRIWLISFTANVASYVLLILPAYLYSLAD